MLAVAQGDGEACFLFGKDLWVRAKVGSGSNV